MLLILLMKMKDFAFVLVETEVVEIFLNFDTGSQVIWYITRLCHLQI